MVGEDSLKAKIERITRIIYMNKKSGVDFIHDNDYIYQKVLSVFESIGQFEEPRIQVKQKASHYQKHKITM